MGNFSPKYGKIFLFIFTVANLHMLSNVFTYTNGRLHLLSQCGWTSTAGVTFLALIFDWNFPLAKSLNKKKFSTLNYW